jgi:hypothetical protein
MNFLPFDVINISLWFDHLNFKYISWQEVRPSFLMPFILKLPVSLLYPNEEQDLLDIVPRASNPLARLSAGFIPSFQRGQSAFLAAYPSIPLRSFKVVVTSPSVQGQKPLL